MIKNKEKIYLSSPHMSGDEQKYIQNAFDTNWVAPLGPNVDGFERELASFVGVKGGTAVSSGTAAIHLALRLLGIQKGDTVFCSSFTFVASANPIVYLGAEPVFIDSEPETWNMSPSALAHALYEANKMGNLPKAIILVHLYGQSAKLDEILSLCHQYNVPIVEDAAESLGSTYKGKASGTFGKFGVYSFNGNKIITTSGGGMLVSNDVGALERARFLATQAKDPAPHYEHSEIGYNYRLSNILAGIGRGQLEVLEDRVRARRFIYKRYYEALSHMPGFYFMPELEHTRPNRWLTTLTIDEKESGISIGKLLRILAEENIEARPMWKPLHMQSLFKEKKYYPHSKNEDVSQCLFQSGICLPSGSNMLAEDQQRVIQSILKAVEWKN
ncbi:pyridoxal phosphate-dependent aminotransferase [Bacillus toyonensis]|uniref:aminotransferase class I/II-fold pyridoxal phosphate-dependent enzyme n=1 Tax=Bacillus toyonensis TaxID=155322 RepID=UPI000BF6AAD5|nr:aminotransferase class I/II-fold pyridoxal phosphate-dependent enzyme [Bacillus toyonensis]PGE16838.1 pyridoxal phosphate-dependent aminotransferase [Bacillus toyonensis]